MTDLPPFFLVWRDDGRRPVFKHTSEGLANAEAERLAHASPGARFYVLAPWSSVKVACVDRERFRVTVDDGIPF